MSAGIGSFVLLAILAIILVAIRYGSLTFDLHSGFVKLSDQKKNVQLEYNAGRNASDLIQLSVTKTSAVKGDNLFSFLFFNCTGGER